MRKWTVSVAGYRRITLGALVALYTIVITGALVRLTGSGLGCADWPRCSEERFIDVSTGHGAIEQVNRLFTGVVAASVILAVLASVEAAMEGILEAALAADLAVEQGKIKHCVPHHRGICPELPQQGVTRLGPVETGDQPLGRLC